MHAIWCVFMLLSCSHNTHCFLQGPGAQCDGEVRKSPVLGFGIFQGFFSPSHTLRLHALGAAQLTDLPWPSLPLPVLCTQVLVLSVMARTGLQSALSHTWTMQQCTVRGGAAWKRTGASSRP